MCGDRHWGLCPNAPVGREKIASMIPSGPPPIRRSGKKFDRNEYQREYMRRYRAKKKGEA